MRYQWALKDLEKAADGDQLKKYGDSKTSLKSKSPRSGKGGKDSDGKELWKLSSNCSQNKSEIQMYNLSKQHKIKKKYMTRTK